MPGLVAGAATLLLLVPGKAAAIGELEFESCLAGSAPTGCPVPFADPIPQPQSMAVSPDGTSVYVISRTPGTASVVAHFALSGRALTYRGCFSTDGSRGCADLPGDLLRTPQEVVVSPEGTTVYVTDFFDGAVVAFSRAAGGELTFKQCLTGAQPAPAQCSNAGVPAQSLAGGHLAISTDGTSVYTGSVGTLVELDRAADGTLSFGGCIGNAASPSCTDIPQTPMPLISGIVVAPNNSHVYVSSRSVGPDEGESVLEFSRAGGGALFFDGCIADSGADLCTDLPQTPITEPMSVAISPDGDSLYVGASGANSIAHFFIAPGGQLGYGGCVADTAEDGCTPLPGALLAEVRNLAISPDGGSLYGASSAPGAISHFSAAPAGQITYVGCDGIDTSRGCAAVSNGVLAPVFELAVTPDGGAVLSLGAGFSTFRRATGAATPAPDTDPPETSLLKKPKKRTEKRKAKFKFTSDEAGASFQCKLDRKPFAPCGSPLKRKVKVGKKHKFKVRAVDVAGNVDQTPAKAKWKVLR